MDHPPNSVKEVAKSVYPGDQGLPASNPFESIRSESHAPAEPNEALLRISQDMARVLERLTAPKAQIDMIRRHGAEEFHGSNMEESYRVEEFHGSNMEESQIDIQELFCILSLGNAFINRVLHMVLHDHQTTTIRILLVLIGFFLTCRTLSSGFWRSFKI